MRPTVLETTLLSYARGFPLRKGKIRLVNALWPYMGGGFMRSATLRHGGYRIKCDLREILQRQFYFFGTYFVEEELLAHWDRFASTSSVVFDIGANAGIYSLAAAAAAGSQVQVHAFEPTPEIASGLSDTIAENGLSANIFVHQLAVSEQAGTATLMRFRGGGDNSNGGMNFIVEGADADAESVGTISIDEFCETQGIEHIDLLKMDIQGHEASALRGARRMLSGGRIGTIFLELNWAPPGEWSSAQECVDLLSDAGYAFAAPSGDLCWRSSGPWLRSCVDIVAAKPSASS